MSFKLRNYDKFVGLFVLFGLFILLLVVVFMGREQKWFAGRLHLQTFFKSGNGLSKGMYVKINDMMVGKTLGVKFAPNNDIEVQFFVYDSFRHMIHSDTAIFKAGGRLILTNSIQHGAELEDGDTLIAKDDEVDDDIAIIEKLLADLATPEGALNQMMHKTLKEINDIATGRSPAGELLASLLTDDKLTADIRKALYEVRKIREDMAELNDLIQPTSPDYIRSTIGSVEQELREATRTLISLQNSLGLSEHRNITSGIDGGAGTIQHNQRARQY
jgi:ABC-type transporter Mla subunit MlaD